MSEPRLLALYAHRPRPYGGAAEYRLYPGKLGIEEGRVRGDLPLAEIGEIRLLYKPRNSTNEGYLTKIGRRAGGRTVAISNLSWKSLMEMERQDADYRRFVEMLIAQATGANPSIRLRAGLPVWLHRLTALAGLLALAALVGMAGRALLDRSFPIALLIGCFGLYFGWWTWRYLGRNRPRDFTPDAIPPDVLPSV